MKDYTRWLSQKRANSRSRAGTSRLAWNHHTAHLRSVLQAAVAGLGDCHRQAQAGRTLLQNHPLMPAAPHSRWRCPALQLCPHTPWGGYSLEGLYGESSGQTHGERTKTQQYKKHRLSNCDHRHKTGSFNIPSWRWGQDHHSFKDLWAVNSCWG